MDLNYKFKTYVSDDLAFLSLERPMMGGDFSEERNFSSVTTYEFPSTLALLPVFTISGTGSTMLLFAQIGNLLLSSP